MSSNHKIKLIHNAIQKQLNLINFVSINGVQLPIEFVIDNEAPKESENFINVISLDSREQLENILLYFPNNTKITDNVKDYNRPLYLSVEIIFPR